VAVFERDILQAIEFLAQHDPGVVLVLDADKRVVFVGGESARAVSGLINAGDLIEASSLGSSDGFEKFLAAVIRSDSSFTGYYESRSSGTSNILWHGNILEAGMIVLKGKMVAGNVRTFSVPGNELDHLRDKERVLSTLLSNLPGMAYRCKNDVEWTMEFVSEGCLELTGYKASSLLGNREISYSDLILPEFRAHVWECVQEAIQDNVQFEVIYKIRTASGEIKWVWEKGVDVYEEGQLVALEGFVTDVTPLMVTEQALHQSEERYRLMAEKTGQMVYDLDLETNEIIWSGAVQEITGCSDVEFQNVDLAGWEDLIHPDDRSKVVKDLEECIARPCPFLSVYRFRRKNGSYLYVEDEGDFVLDASGNPVRMVGAIKNYSDKMKVQELMIQSEKMTTVASLSAGMAHEINNPLGVISQSAQNIERRLSPDFERNIEVAESLGVSLELVKEYLDKRKVTTMVEAIKDASTRAARIIINMLNFSRKSGAKKELCELNVMLDRVLEMAETDFSSDKDYDFKKVKIIRECQSDLPEVLCFCGELEQVLFNLVRNAAQAMCTEGVEVEDPTIHIRITSNSAYVTLEVEDNGPGMDAYTRKKVFEPFFTTKRQGLGNGLGLSIAYFIVTRNHGGSISIDSELGKGVKFTISLPLGPVAELYSQGTT